MVWFRVDDRFHGSDPVKLIPREQRAAAIGLWTLAGTWSSQFLKDGFVPGHMIEDFAATTELADALVEVGLWKPRRGGYVFVDWKKWQPTRESVESKRQEAALRVAKYRARRAGKPMDEGDSNAPVTRNEKVRNGTVPPSRPDPTRPIKETPKGVSPAFENAWSVWPKKTEKKDAQAQFAKAASKLPVSELIAAITKFGDAYAVTTERRFVPALGVWLRGERWTDELPTASAAQQAPSSAASVQRPSVPPTLTPAQQGLCRHYDNPATCPQCEENR